MFDQISSVPTSVATKVSTDVGVSTAASIAVGLGAMSLAGGLFAAALGIGIQNVAEASVGDSATVQIATTGPILGCSWAGTHYVLSSQVSTSTVLSFYTLSPSNCEFELTGNSTTTAWTTLNTYSTVTHYSDPIILTAPDDYTVSIRCTETAPPNTVNTDVCNLALRINTLPTFTMNGPSVVVAGTSNTWTFSWSDPDPQTLNHWIGWGDNSYNINTTSISHIYTQPGTYTITTNLNDGLETIQTNQVVTVTPAPDTVNPVVSINAPTTASTYTTYDSPITFVGTANDNVGVTQVSWANSQGGSGVASGTNVWNTGALSLQPGVNIMTVTATDAAGNTGTDVITVTYTPDAIAPTVTITSPAANALIRGVVGVFANVTDNVQVALVTFYFDSPNFLIGGDSTSPYSSTHSTTGEIDGPHQFIVSARDAAGNAATSTVNVIVDNGAPTVTISSPSGGSTFTSPSITIAGTATDATSGVATVEVQLNGGAWQTANGTASWSGQATLLAGSNLISVRSKDVAGNYSGIQNRNVTYTQPASQLLSQGKPVATAFGACSITTTRWQDSCCQAKSQYMTQGICNGFGGQDPFTVKASDGSASTLWCSKKPFSAGSYDWVQVDLSATKNITRVRLDSGNLVPYACGYPVDFKVQVSTTGTATTNCNDGNGWTTVKTVSADGSAIKDITLNPVPSGRYVRICASKVVDNAGWRMSAKEFQVFGY